jgi:membrane-associated phospholipid phosphatase
MYVGCSRVHANRHWADDVFAGATLSMFYSWLFPKPYHKDVTIAPDLGSDYYSLTLQVNF